ncbi:MAG: hypothetical protein HQK65_01835 [Desulfamplus sp.]|nr:hypothetical protein [Desulfamplus sp.]
MQNFMNFKRRVSDYVEKLENDDSVEVFHMELSVTGDLIDTLSIFVENVAKDDYIYDLVAYGFCGNKAYAKPGIFINNIEKDKDVNVEFAWVVLFSLDGKCHLFTSDSNAVSVVIDELFGGEESFKQHYQVNSCSIDSTDIEPFEIALNNAFF